MADRRAFVIVMDSVGIGALPDAPAYGDAGSDTLGHVAAEVGLAIPTLRALGLLHVAGIDDAPARPPLGAAGRMAEASPGKDSVTGHWELFGVVLDRPFPTFPSGFPPDVITEFERRTGHRVLGNRPASGTAIIEELGGEHVQTGALIVYTSADSVFQIAAHEAIVPVDELYRFCDIAFDLVCHGLGVGRVIARPFTGRAGAWRRTANRRDFARPPAGPTLFDRLLAGGWSTLGIGKIEDLFAGRGIARAVHTRSDAHGLEELGVALATCRRGLVAANLVDFDTEFGHRNDPAGYARNLERFDAALAGFLPALRPADLLVVTADHGNDPTTPSTDHSREYVPVLVTGPPVRPGVDLGTRPTFADLGQTLAEWFGVAPLDHGQSFLADILR